MGDATTIEWTDATWNPIRGCRRTAPAGSKQSGCGDPSGGGCYAERQAARFSGSGQPYEGLITLTANGPRWSGKTRFVAEHLADPLRWRRGRRIFVDSMSDLFYEGFSDEEIAAVMGVMVLAAQHTYQILTKRPERMRDWFRRWTADACLDVLARVTMPSGESIPGPREWNHPPHQEWYSIDRWPIPWIWLGVSVENQAAAYQRIPPLLDTPAGVHFLSIEPMIGPIDLGPWMSGPEAEHGGFEPSPAWIIAGCESGPGARPADVVWFRSLRDQCEKAGTAFFLKQAVGDALERCEQCCDEVTCYVHGPDDGSWSCGCTAEGPEFGGTPIVGAGEGSHRKGGGVIGAPYLDGVQHLAFPEVPRG